VERIALSKEVFITGSPETFLAIDFFEHDTQTTPVAEGLQPVIDFSIRYEFTFRLVSS